MNQNNSTFKKQFQILFPVFFVPFAISFLMLLTFVFEWGMHLDFSRAGILPRNTERLWALVTHVFVHASWGHLFNNVISFVLLSSCLVYFYRPQGLKLMTMLWILSATMLWVIGRPSYHIGASGLIYALASFLFLSGLIRKHIPLIAVSLIVTVLYGNMVWYIFPWQAHDPVSWEGHLSGMSTGFILAVIYKNHGPQRPEKVWNDELDDENDYWNDTGSDNPEPVEKSNPTTSHRSN